MLSRRALPAGRITALGATMDLHHELQGRRFITEKDLLKFTWIADPQISPDGSTVAFVRVTVNEKDNKYESSLFAVPSSSGSESPQTR